MASTTSSSDNADPSTALRKRKGSGHDDDDLDALESVSSSSTSVPASCKRPHLHSPHSTYQEGALKQLRELFGDRADVAMIESVYYDQCDEDTHRAIARLVAATGLHAELVQQQSGSQQQQWQQEEEKQQEAKTEEKANQRAAFRYVEVAGDLFSSPPHHSLCHCISTDIAMGKGIAVSFKSKFGGVEELKKQNKGIGQVATLRREQRYIYYLITKAKYWNKPSYESLQASLEDMRAHAQTHEVTHLSMPRIAAGLDGLLWPKVRDIIQRVFADTPLTITVYSRD